VPDVQTAGISSAIVPDGEQESLPAVDTENTATPPQAATVNPQQPAANSAAANSAATNSAATNSAATNSAATNSAVANNGTANNGTASGVNTVSSAAVPADSTPDAYLTKAKSEYDAGRIGGALGILDQYKNNYPGLSDEAYWLYGQALEANSPNRDIKLALDYYRRLIKEYPQSDRYDAARRRIAYLERFYFNIQ
jgi:outer membrane protein assembly factor BamD (BamD/ComL family)